MKEVITKDTASVATIWENSARKIGDILSMSDVVDPFTFISLPFVNQAFFVAGCCNAKGECLCRRPAISRMILSELEQISSKSPGFSREKTESKAQSTHHHGSVTSSQHSDSDFREPTAYRRLNLGNRPWTGRSEINSPLQLLPESRPADRPSAAVSNSHHVHLSQATSASVAANNIQILQHGLSKQNLYWAGTAWISSVLDQRLQGRAEVDLGKITENLASVVSLPDAGVVG